MSGSDMRGDRHQSKDVDARDKPGHDGWLLVETQVPDIALLIRATLPPRLEEDRFLCDRNARLSLTQQPIHQQQRRDSPAEFGRDKAREVGGPNSGKTVG